MSARDYLPSAQFALMVGSLLFAGGLVIAAEHLTSKKPFTVALSPGVTVDSSDWQQTLSAIQNSNSSTSLPAPVAPGVVDQALQEVKTSNLTDTVGRSLFVNLTNAKSQGLGDDIPTQNQILANAISQIKQTPQVTFSESELTLVEDTNASRHAYGNQVISIMNRHPNASAVKVLLAIGYATDNNDQSQLQTLSLAGKEYGLVASELVRLPVPKSLAPLHLLAVNDLEGMSESIISMQTLLVDPLRGAQATQQFNSLLSEETSVLTNIAQQMQKDNIIYGGNEPGRAWSTFLNPTS